MLANQGFTIHDSWGDINGSTPMHAKKLKLKLFKPLNLGSYQLTEVTVGERTSSRHHRVGISHIQNVMKAL